MQQIACYELLPIHNEEQNCGVSVTEELDIPDCSFDNKVKSFTTQNLSGLSLK
jgi:hypothetical protein